MHNIDHRQRSQACTRVCMVPPDMKGSRKGSNVEVRYKIDTGAGENVIHISVFKRLCAAMFDSTGKLCKGLTLIGPPWQHMEVLPSSSNQWVMKGI